MMREKRVEAVLESKYVMENHNAPLSTGMIFAYADQSQSFFSRDMQYVLRFDLGSGKIEFQVDRRTYERQQEGKRGLLVYLKNVFIRFEA